jgi:hypothetical protein
MGLENVPRCQHVKTNGTQCGSPALRRRRLCFFHDRIRREQARIAADVPLSRTFELPLLEDANSVQVALMKVIQMLASGRMEHKTAGLILYALQTAAVNLRYADFEVNDVNDIVIDPDTVNATCINGPQWIEEDFDDAAEEEEDAADSADAEDEPAVVAAPAEANSRTNKPSQTREITTEQARKEVQGVVHDWILKTIGQNPAVKPG